MSEASNEDEEAQRDECTDHHSTLFEFRNEISVEECTEEAANTRTIVDTSLPSNSELIATGNLARDTDESTMSSLEGCYEVVSECLAPVSTSGHTISEEIFQQISM